MLGKDTYSQGKVHDLVTQKTSVPMSHSALGLGSADKGTGLVAHFCPGDLVLQKMLSNLRGRISIQL